MPTTCRQHFQISLVLREQGLCAETVKAEAAESDKIILELMAQIATETTEAALAAQVKTEKGA